MQLVRFLLKFAFICNCCFLLIAVLQRIDTAGKFKGLTSGLAVLGLLAAPYLNVVSLLGALLLLLLHRISWKALPPWVFICNVFILLLQIFT
ncbi:hypothetical protein GA0116948_10819 [Chitinophaga costaii]|uniref:Uncharacterized protein n=1 Tax=Chitinophaga costaii TaxID=1335309 RepID=A0A1C4ECT1_9BACT|nr:hypothetical protein [Chitinophaga costaii]PUZ23903.1 hypothetical protein DCM91_14030 [Chitinophaga costaii]SCC41429.1 hypothetical protein GA0116948_10819 [Chitinophaga costaii]